MEKYNITSLKQLGKTDKKMRKSSELILINRKNYNEENEKIRTNKSFTNPIKCNILNNNKNQINIIKNKTIKYYLNDYQKSDYINNNNNNFRDSIALTKSQRIFNFFKKKNTKEENKNEKNKYRYQISTNPYKIFNNDNNIKENNKISINKSNEFNNIKRKTSITNLQNIQKLLSIHDHFQRFLKTQKIIVKQNYEINKTPRKKTPKVKKRPYSIKYNHIEIQKNIKKVNEIFDLNGNNINKKIGEQLTKYTLGKTLGKGAYALVKLVTDKVTKIDYAMKIYKKNEIKDKVRKKCVNNEIDILKKIQHKNVIKLIEVIDLKDYILIVEELFIGISLGQYHKKYWKTEDLSRKKEKVYKIILTQIFSAINYLHSNGIAHLDIKMDNILINDKLDIKIIDFGFAIYDPKNELNKFFGGTPNYMSPEIILKRPYISILSDIWSLGVLVYKLFCNEYPFKGMTEKDLYNSIKKGKFRIKCFVNYDVKKIINSMLVLEPNKRTKCDMLLKLPWFFTNNK